MKKLVLLAGTMFAWLCAGAQSLRGRVTDAATRQPIEGASVYIPEIKLGAATDRRGVYIISGFPKGTYDVEVQAIGYATITRQVEVAGSDTVDFAATVSYSPLWPVVVTSLGNVTNTWRSPVPVSVVGHDQILQGSVGTAVDEVASLPGVDETTEGVGTTKPQINGLGFNRVLTLTDGLPQEDFQWGDDHGILIDPYVVYDAEVIRGPASLQYGASAEAGVINFKTAPFAPGGTTRGSWLTEYHANNGYAGNSLQFGGNHKGFIYDVEASAETAHSYWNPKDGYVWGSAWDQANGRVALGWNKTWGYSRVSLSALRRRIEVPDGNRDSTGQFEFDFPQNRKLYPTLSNFLSYNASIASDKILEEYQAWWQNSFTVGRGAIGADIGFTRSVHHDIDTGTVGQGNMIVNDIPYSLKYRFDDLHEGLKLTTGINGIYEFERNLPEPPMPYVADFEIPNYSNFEIGGYGIVEKDFKRLTLSGGLRYDVTDFVGQGMSLVNPGTPRQAIVPDGTQGSVVQFTGFNNTYSGWSGSIGTSYQLPGNNYLKLNVSKSFRAPAINELTSNGLNIGSNAIQLGNIDLKAEEGYQFDLALGHNGRDISLDIDGFYNHISHFIFADRTDSSSQGYPVYQFVSSNTAVLTGVSGYLNIHPAGAKWFELDNGLTFIYTSLPGATDSTNHIPWTPAPHLNSEVKFLFGDRKGSLLEGIYFKVGTSKYWEQNNVYGALHTELPSAAYTLVNAGLGTNFVNRKNGRLVCSLFVNCTNLTNIAYADHLNLAQYFYAVNGNVVTVTNQRQGVFNMGRDISAKVVFPFGGK